MQGSGGTVGAPGNLIELLKGIWSSSKIKFFVFITFFPSLFFSLKFLTAFPSLFCEPSLPHTAGTVDGEAVAPQGPRPACVPSWGPE